MGDFYNFYNKYRDFSGYHDDGGNAILNSDGTVACYLDNDMNVK